MRKRIGRFSRGAGLCGILALALLGSPSAKASPACLAGTIASVMLQGACTIGDKTFDFTDYYPYSYGSVSSPNSATDVTFTPLTSNPLDPGFELGAFDSTAGDDTYEYGYLDYDVSVTNGSANLIGVNENVNNPTLSTVPGANSLDDAYLQADNDLDTSAAEAYQEVYQYQSTGSSPSSLSYSSGPVTFTPVSSGSGYVFFQTGAYDYNYNTDTVGGGGTAEAAMSSVDYTFQQESVTPEPGTMVLFGSGLLLFGGILRRHWRAAA
jgi:hypothetical protein